MNIVGDKIDEFIEVELKANPEQVGPFFERVQANYEEAIRSATRFLILMFALWFVSAAISKTWISKIALVGFDCNPQMTVASPFLIGLLSYLELSSLAGAIVLWEAIIRRLRFTLPTVWKLNLEDFLAPPTFSNVERLLEPMIDRKPLSVIFSRSWFLLVTAMMFLGGLVGIIHTTYLLFWPREGQPPVTHWWVILISAAFGVVAWLRGVVLAASTIQITGGYDRTHHRGKRMAPSPDQAPEDCPATLERNSLVPPK